LKNTIFLERRRKRIKDKRSSENEGMRIMTKKEIERFLAVANNDQELMMKYLQAPTEEERQAIIQAMDLSAGEGLAELRTSN